ncbi:MAG: cation:proton antiporter subunit C [Bacillota bacterium]
MFSQYYHLLDYLAGYVSWWLIGVLFLIGLYGIIVKENLLKKIMALNVMQVAVILFFLNVAQKSGATLAVLLPGEKAGAVDIYVNPLPHALMLTAIVVSLAVMGVAMALVIQVYRCYGSLEEPEVLRRMRK